MVDRITPATGEDERRRCKEEFGIEDAQPVFCEAYRQWVLEDNFPAGRPPLEQLGVLFVNDVTPYENMKVLDINLINWFYNNNNN
jgi:mannitol 2-dehydrogenase